jgi:acyl-coenzyme A synthetase/AMP-(fatty) acid ligase
VTAVPDPVRGDEVLALVVVREGITADAGAGGGSDCASRSRGSPIYKAPGYVAFSAALPLTPTEKIQRGALKTLAAGLLEGGQCLDRRHLKKRQDP